MGSGVHQNTYGSTVLSVFCFPEAPFLVFQPEIWGFIYLPSDMHFLQWLHLHLRQSSRTTEEVRGSFTQYFSEGRPPSCSVGLSCHSQEIPLSFFKSEIGFLLHICLCWCPLLGFWLLRVKVGGLQSGEKKRYSQPSLWTLKIQSSSPTCLLESSWLLCVCFSDSFFF